MYNTNYQPIRHKPIAHKYPATIGGRDSLFAKTNIGEVEAILEILYQVRPTTTAATAMNVEGVNA